MNATQTISVYSNRDDIWKYIDSNHYIPSTGNGESIMPEACAIQNVSDTHHDGLNPDAARNTLPFKPKDFRTSPDLSEDDFLTRYLYDLNKGTPKTTTTREYLYENYHCFFRIPLIHGETTNVGSTGEPQYPDRNSVLETIFDELGLANQNIYVSKDFGFPAMQYDFTYFKNRQIYIGYRPAQENDAAGKPTLTSSKAFEFGFQSPNIKVDFIWTTPEIDQGFTHLPRWKGGTPDESPTLNYSLLDYDTMIRWDPKNPGPSANALKSQTFFVKPEGENYARSIIYQSNSEWTSKSGKELKAYQQFNNGALEILKKNPLALGDPITSANKAITATDFDEFHSLAKRSGDALTAYIKPTNPQYFIRLNPKSADVSGPTEKFDLTDFAFLYQTHDRLAAAGALTRKVEMVILESPRDNEGKSYFSLFIRKDMLDVKKMYNTIKEKYFDPNVKLENKSPYDSLITELGSITPETIKNIDAIIKSVDPTWSSSIYDNKNDSNTLTSQVGSIITELDSQISKLTSENDDNLIKYIKLQILKKTVNDILNELNSLNSDHINIDEFFANIISRSTLPVPVPIRNAEDMETNDDDKMKKFIADVVFPFNEYRSCMKTHKSLNALAVKINDLPKNVDELLANLGTLVQLNKTTIDSLNNIKPNIQINITSKKRITGRFNPLKLFATSKDRLNILLSTDLHDLFGFPELLLKLWDKLPEDALPTIYNYYHNAYEQSNAISSANPNNHDLEIITQCLGFVFREQYKDATTFKTDLMEFGEHKDLLLTEKKTKDDFMFELPAILKPLSKKKMIAQEEKKKTILSKIVNFTNRMLGRIVPTRGGKKTRVRRCKIVGKRTKKYRGGVDKKRGREDDNDVQPAKRIYELNVKRKERDDDDDNNDDGNNGPTKKIRPPLPPRDIPPPTPRDIELLFRILGVFVFFLTFLRDKRDMLKMTNPNIRSFCDKRIDKINAFVKKLYNDNFDILIRLFPTVNPKNMFHYGPGEYSNSNDIYKCDPNYYDPIYEKYINNMPKLDKTKYDTKDNTPIIDTRIDLFYYDNNIPLEDKIVYLFAQYIPFFIKNNEKKNTFNEYLNEYETFVMLYDNTMTSVIMYIIGTYIGDVDLDQEPSTITDKVKSVKKYLPIPIENIIDLEPDANVSPILGFLPTILIVDDLNTIDDSKLNAFIRRTPVPDTLPNIINTTMFGNYKIHIQQQFHNVSIKNVEKYIDRNDFKLEYVKVAIYPDPNHDIDIFKRGLDNIKKQNPPFQPPSMKTGVFNMPDYSNYFDSLFNTPKSVPVNIGGYKSSRKNKKYRKPRKYRYR